MLVFVGGKPENLGKNPRSVGRTNNKLSIYEPGAALVEGKHSHQYVHMATQHEFK